MDGEPLFPKRFFLTLPESDGVFPSERLVSDAFVVGHLRKVMRMRPGDFFLAVDGERERVYPAEIVDYAGQACLIRLLEDGRPVETSPLPTITLAAALLKEKHWDWLLQKGTELGVRRFAPLRARRSVVRVEDAERKSDRWRDIIRSAAAQSDGAFLPQLQAPLHVKALCEQAPSDAIKVLLLERGDNRTPLRTFLEAQGAYRKAPWIVAAGPEGGWIEEEERTFRQAGFQPVSLGSRIVRAETASIALMAALTMWFEGDPSTAC